MALSDSSGSAAPSSPPSASAAPELRAVLPLSPLLRALSLSARWLVGLSAGLALALLGGQLAQLRGALALADLLRPETRHDALCALGAGLAAMGEAALPLACLLATGLAYARLRAEGALRAWETLGLPPALLLTPALSLSLPCAALALHLARDVTPYALSDLSPRLARLAASRLSAPGEPIALSEGGVARVRAVGAQGEGGGASEVWAAWPALGLHARGALDSAAPHEDKSERAAGGPPALRLRGVEVRSARGRARFETLTLRPSPPHRLRSAGPPNSTPTHALDPRNPHHTFTLHKRHSLPLSAPLWSLLGALLGLRARAPLALTLGALAVGVSYSLLRALELRARFGGGDPALAAWAPVLLLAVCVTLGLRSLSDLSAPLRPTRQRKSTA